MNAALPLHLRFAEQAAATPDAVALLGDDGTVTYAALDRRSNRLAHLLIDAGVTADSPVVVRLPRGPGLVVALLAIWKAGGAYVPVDPDHPAARTAEILADTRATVLVGDVDRGEAGVRTVVLDPAPDALRDRPATAPDVPVTADQAAYVLYTSGSTGRPKGVVITHGGIANRVAWTVGTHRLGPDDRVLQKTAITFDAAGWEIFAPLVSGGTVVLAPPGAERDPGAVVGAAGRHGVTVLQVVPSVLRRLIAEPGWDSCDRLRLLCSAGEPLHAELVQRFLALVEESAGDVEVWNTYGPTECSIDVTAQRFDPLQRSGPVSIGRPIDAMRVVIAGPDGREVAPGESGELLVGGVGVARGYLGRPAFTAERFVPDPSGEPGLRLYRTGDLARRRPGGTLDYLGRLDQQVKINGVRIEPAEVEAALAAHPDVLEAVVVPYPAADGTTRLAAHFRGRATTGQLRAFLLDRLPESYLPSTFVAAEDFPVTTSGKIDRAALSTAGPAPRRYLAPASPAEELLARLWQDLLESGPVGAGEDFFELGGTSLQLTRLANRLRLAGHDVALRALLATPVLRDQAALLTRDRVTEPAIQPAPRGGPLPLSAGQRRLWLLDRMEPRSREWVTGVFLPVPPGTGEAEVRRGLDELISRHEALRTRFVLLDGEPAQIVDPPVAVPLRVAHTDPGAVGELVEQEASAGFDLETGPMARALLAVPDSAGTEPILVLLTHHIAADGWSAAVLRREFGEIIAGRGAALAPPPVQYADFAAWERNRLDEDTVRRELTHWRATLDGAEPTELPSDRRRPPVRDPRGAVTTFTVAPGTVHGLAEIGRSAGATLFMTTLTAFATLLARHSGRWDVTLGTPVAGRDRPELEGVVGFFLNNLVLRCDLDRHLPFGEAVRRVRDTCRAAFAHQDLPFDSLVAELAPARDLSRTPLYQIAFDFHDARLTGSPDDPAELRALVGASTIAKTDLTLYLRELPDGSLFGVLEYATALFDPATVRRLADHFGRLLTAAAAGPATTLADLGPLPAAERDAILAAGRNPVAPVTEPVLDGFEAQAARRPDATAVVADDGSLTFRELDERAELLAGHLRAHGVRPGDAVGVLLDRGVDLPAAFLGVWKAGACYLPLDPAAPAARVAAVLADASVPLLITGGNHPARLAGALPASVTVLDAGRDLTGPAPGAAPVRAPRDLDSLAYVIYTSGSTGTPKGVQITHGGLANHVRWAVGELMSRGAGGGAVFSSVAFDLVVPNVWAPLLAGRPILLLPQDLDLTELGPRLRAAAPFAFLKLTPGHLQVLADQLPDAELASLAAVVVVAGEVLPVAVAEHWAGLLGPDRLINEYGPTETSVGACTHPVAAVDDAVSIPIGRPLPGVDMHVLDDLMRPVPVGVVGELYVGGLGVARGYRGRPALTGERFLPHPYGPPGSRLYRTGDLARMLPGGAIDFNGRIDDQVKIRGYRVEPAEIAAVAGGHPGVREAVVVPDRTTGPDVRLVAYCVPDPDVADPSALPAAVTRHCAERLPDYLVPAAVVVVEAIPLTANGKLDRRALPVPADAAVTPADAPVGIVEERIAEIFAGLLGADAGRDGDFFARGGNSILAIRLIAAVQSAFDVNLPIRAVFERPTVAGLAAAVEAVIRAEADGLSAADLVAGAGAGDSRPTTP
jgi:amino acid adenylation domain-containing protein